MMILTALLGIGFIFALAGDFVLWAKVDEQKKATEEERDRRWDEISRALSIEKEKDAEIAYWKEANDDKIGDILFYHAEYGKLESAANRSEIQRIQMQDRLSALLCPTNNHVWKDGVCTKCGRAKNG